MTDSQKRDKNKICFLGFMKLFSLAKQVIDELPPSDADYLLVDCNPDTQAACVQEALNAGCEVFIAGSGNAAWFSSHYSYPLIEIAIRPVDYAVAIHNAKEAGFGRIAVLRQRYAASLDISMLETITEISLTELVYETYQELLQAVQNSDCDAVVGAAAAISAAQQFGKAGFDIYLSTVGIHDACLRAAELARELKRARWNREVTKAVMDNSQLGIIISDPNDKVRLFNRTASKYTELLSGQIRGQKLGEFFPNLAAEPFLKTGQRRSDSYKLVRDSMMRCVQERIETKGETIAVLTTLYPEAHNRRGREEKRGINAHIWNWDELTAESDAMKQLVRNGKRVTSRHQPLVILGEPGSGREEIAYCIHGSSARAKQPCVTLDLASVDDRDAARTFFGYADRGQYVDGILASVNHGSLVLKSLSLAGPATLACLKELLSGSPVFRPGMESAISPDICIFSAASKKELESLPAEMRSLLSIGSLAMPSLRERREDIPILFVKYVELLSEVSGIGRLTQEMTELLQQYSWPGNVRELRAVCTRYALARSDAGKLTNRAKYLTLLHAIGDDFYFNDLVERYPALKNGPSADREAFLAAAQIAKEKMYLSNDALADRLGISRTTLWRIMRESAMTEQK